MATLIEMASHPGSGATAVEVVESRKGGRDLTTMEKWEERVYIMQFSNTTWVTADAETASGVPADGASLGAMYATQKTTEPDAQDQTVVRVRVMFKTLRPNGQQPHIHSTESIWSVVKRIEDFPTEQRVDIDNAGKPIVNCLGEAMIPPVTKLVYDQKITIDFMTNASASQYFAFLQKGQYNTDSFTITIGACGYALTPGSTVFSQYTSADAWDADGVRCAAMHLELLVRDEGTSSWYDVRPNLSLCKANNTNSPLTGMTPILTLPTDTTSAYITEPQFLDVHGGTLATGTSITSANLNFFITRDGGVFAPAGTVTLALLTGLLS